MFNKTPFMLHDYAQSSVLLHGVANSNKMYLWFSDSLTILGFPNTLLAIILNISDWGAELRGCCFVTTAYTFPSLVTWDYRCYPLTGGVCAWWWLLLCLCYSRSGQCMADRDTIMLCCMKVLEGDRRERGSVSGSANHSLSVPENLWTPVIVTTMRISVN